MVGPSIGTLILITGSDTPNSVDFWAESAEYPKERLWYSDEPVTPVQKRVLWPVQLRASDHIPVSVQDPAPILMGLLGSLESGFEPAGR